MWFFYKLLWWEKVTSFCVFFVMIHCSVNYPRIMATQEHTMCLHFRVYEEHTMYLHFYGVFYWSLSRWCAQKTQHRIVCNTCGPFLVQLYDQKRSCYGIRRLYHPQQNQSWSDKCSQLIISYLSWKKKDKYYFKNKY